MNLQMVHKKEKCVCVCVIRENDKARSGLNCRVIGSE